VSGVTPGGGTGGVIQFNQEDDDLVYEDPAIKRVIDANNT
jgi:hypothetical protein